MKNNGLKNRDPETDAPCLTRSQMAILLNCTIQTIANREKSGMYPPPKRDEYDDRYYTIEDVLELMKITTGKIVIQPLVALLYDLGYTDVNLIQEWLVKHLNKVLGPTQTNLGEVGDGNTTN